MRSSREESASWEEMALLNGRMLGMCACYFVGGGYEGMVSISMAGLFFVRCCVFDGITLYLRT